MTQYFEHEDINQCRSWLRQQGCTLDDRGWMKGERPAALQFRDGKWHAWICG